jgi:cell division protein ZapA (FtsZ GTPase activity inhibitor)
MTQTLITIAGRVYPLSVREEEVNVVREAAEIVNNKINEVRKTYDGKDNQDYLAMVLMNFAVELLNNQHEGTKNLSELNNKLSQLDAVLSS